MTPAYAALLEAEQAWPPAVDLGRPLLEAPVNYPHWHEFNPWGEFSVYVTVEELAECHKLIGTMFEVRDDYETLTAERVKELWYMHGSELDAYIIPDALLSPGLPLAGVRYGAEGYEYIQPYCDSSKLIELLKTYGWKPHN